MKYLVKKGNKYLNSHVEKVPGVKESIKCSFDTLEYAWGFDSIADAQEWADLSGGTVVLPIKAYSEV
jgi:hypothetical protein